MADAFVVHWQLTEDLLLVRLQLCQKIFELCFVEDCTGREGPYILQLSLGSRGNSSEDHFSEAVLRPLLNAHRIGNSMRLLVIRRSRFEFRLKVTAMSVFFASAIPGCFDLKAVGDIPLLDPEQAAQREFRHQSISRPMDSLPAIDRARRYRQIDRNLRGQLLIGITRQPHLRRAELRTQESLLQINGPYRFGEEEIDGHSGIGLSQYLGYMLLHDSRGQKGGIAEFHLCDLERSTFDPEFL